MDRVRQSATVIVTKNRAQAESVAYTTSQAFTLPNALVSHAADSPTQGGLSPPQAELR
jgi:hypothetical protein